MDKNPIGRPKGEPTKVIRIPIKFEAIILRWIERKQNLPINTPQTKKLS